MTWRWGEKDNKIEIDTNTVNKRFGWSTNSKCKGEGEVKGKTQVFFKDRWIYYNIQDTKFSFS